MGFRAFWKLWRVGLLIVSIYAYGVVGLALYVPWIAGPSRFNWGYAWLWTQPNKVTHIDIQRIFVEWLAWTCFIIATLLIVALSKAKNYLAPEERRAVTSRLLGLLRSMTEYTKIDSFQSAIAVKSEEDAASELKNEKWVLVVMGCHCSGKTAITKNVRYPSGIKLLCEIGADEMGIAEKRIWEALQSGWKVLLEVVYCDNPEILIRRAAARATSEEKNRESPIVYTLDQMSQSFIAVPEAALKLLEVFGRKVEFLSVNNSKKISEISFTVRRGSPPIVQAVAEVQHRWILDSISERL